MAKRGSNEGSIYKRGDGRWVGVVHLGYEGGRRRRKHIYGKTRQEAARRLSVALRAREQGLPQPAERQTVANFLADWLETVRPSLRAKTFRTYSDLIRLHIVPTLGRTRLARLEPQRLQQLYADLGQHLSSMSVRHVHSVLRRALRDAVRWGAVPRNFAELVTPPRAATTEVRTFSPEQARMFLDVARDDRLYALYVLALSTGMRQGELLALCWESVDLDGASLQVRGTLQRADGALVVMEPKTRASRRQIALSSEAVSALRRHRLGQHEERLKLGPAWENRDLTFANEVGRPIDARNLVRSSFLPALKRAGLPRLRFHDLRHSAATLMMGRDVHPKIVSEMLGHARISTTLDLYSHVTPTMQREAAAVMDSVLSGS